MFAPVLVWAQEEAVEPGNDALAAREAAIAERELQLIEREEELARREAELAPQEDPVSEEPGPWSGEFGLGYIASKGNTDTSSGTARLKINYNVNAWENWVEGKAFGSSDDEGTTAEAYEVVGRSLYNFNPKNYGYGQIEWKKNRFSAYTQQTFETVGYGHRFIDNDLFKLNLEVGAGLTQQKAVVQSEPEVIIENQRGAVYTAGGQFFWQITAGSSFEQLASARMASDNTNWETITRLKVNIIETLALAVAYNIQGNTDVGDDVDKTDRYTSITLDYSF
jgi:putative salt-induced outer membrane protein